MVSERRKHAADTELGRRHPVLTLYGGWMVAAAAVTVVLAALVLAVRKAAGFVSLPASPNLHPAWLLLTLVPLGLWLWLSPSRRLNRDIRRQR